MSISILRYKIVKDTLSQKRHPIFATLLIQL